MRYEVKPTVRMGWRTDRGAALPCTVEVVSVRGNERQYNLKGTGELYGPFPSREAARKFIVEYALNKIASVSIRPIHSMEHAIETFGLVKAKPQPVVKPVAAIPQPKTEYGPFTLRARARVSD